MPISPDTIAASEFNEDNYYDGDSESLVNELKSCINNSNDCSSAADLFGLLHKKFLYNKQAVRIRGEEQLHYRFESESVIEMLFFSHPDKLLEIINALINMNTPPKNNPLLFNAFLEALRFTTLKPEILFAWTDKMQQQVNTQLKNMHDHGKELKEQKVPRGTTLTTLHAQLSTQLQRLTTSNQAESKQPSVDTHSLKQFRILQFKLQAAITSHRNDATFSSHRGWSRWLLAPLGNLFFGLLAGAWNLGIIPGIAYKYGFYFSTKTTSTDLVKSLNNTLAIDHKDEIQFNNSRVTRTLHSK